MSNAPMSLVDNNGADEIHDTSQLPVALELLSDFIEKYHTAFVLIFSSLICIVLSAMFILRQRIVRQENKVCINRSNHKVNHFSPGKFGTPIVKNQPASRPIVFSENVSESMLNEMPQQKAEIIRTEQSIASNLTEQQKATEAEIQRQQLEAIFNLMNENKEKFGESSMSQIYEQATMYGR